MKRINYGKQVKVWTAQYMNDPSREQAERFNPTAFKLRVCSKCGRVPKRPLERHHKGHEFLFANILPKFYAKRYLEFRAEDIDYLCHRCHKNETRYTKPIINRIVTEYKSIGNMTHERCEFWRSKLIKTYNKWLSLKPRRKGVNKWPPIHLPSDSGS